MKVAGFVLTGGQSVRMGRDKALLPVGSHTLCEHVAGIVSSVAGNVLLIGHPERYSHLRYRCIADLRPGLGPLSGLETALNLRLAEFNLIASCDAANINTRWLEALLDAAGRHDALCTVIEDGNGKLQPLCGVYRSSCGPLVSKSLSEGRLRAMELIKELGAQPVKVKEIVLNLNTPAEYDELLNAHRGN
jgi:molybdopterin-guanine dinucleotide biosynthesis protein A